MDTPIHSIPELSLSPSGTGNSGSLFIELSQLAATVGKWQELVAGMLNISLKRLHANYGWFSIYDKKSNRLKIEYLSGISVEVIEHLTAIFTSTSSTGEIFMMNGLHTLFPEEKGGFPSAMICYPFFTGDTFLGSLFLCKESGAFSETDQKELEALCYFSSKLVDNAIMFRQLQHAKESMNELIEKIHILEKMKTHLSKFVPTSVLQLIEASPENPKFDKTERDVSVLFLDIVGYTAMNQDLEPQDVNYIVETYFSSFIDDIYRNKGDINETAGDGLMILFLDDDLKQSAKQAVTTAKAIKQKIEFVERNLTSPLSVKVNIGIHSGPALVGSVQFRGSSGDRWTFTASGMTTNISSRITKYARNGEILISKDTVQLLDSRQELQEVGWKEFKNVRDPLFLYRLSA
ncbi:MAG: adenylate/guanylate cyclase domain-containing protein [Candidatus Auribacterota bacterium]